MTAEHNNSTTEIITSTDVKEGLNYDIWRTPKLIQDQFESLSVNEKLLYLITLAHMAPSTHNTQPWAFSFFERKLRGAPLAIYLDRDRVLPASDARGRQAVISVGAALGNIEIAASHFGLNTIIRDESVTSSQVLPYKLTDDKGRYVKLCKIGFDPSGPDTNDGLYDAIFTRRINRNITDTTGKIPYELQMEIQTLENPGTHLYILTAGDPRIAGIAEFQGQADAYVANSKKFAGELGNWLMENDTKDFLGMPGDTFDMTIAQAKHTKYALQGKEILSANDIAAFSRGSTSGIRTASIVGMITVDKDVPEYWLKSGKLLGRIGLTLTRHGMSYAIHAGLAEVSLTRFGLSKAIFTTGTPAILFRAGYPRPDLTIPPHSPRLPIEEIII